MKNTVLITGGAGFIGQNFVHRLVNRYSDLAIVVIDALTYSANMASLMPLIDAGRITFVEADIVDSDRMLGLLGEQGVTLIAHLAAESHVDRSIADPDAFFRTNVEGTYALLKAARTHWERKCSTLRFLHVSTDEVFGDLTDDAPPFTEDTPYRPSSPYSASKAASDHLARAFQRTYGLPVIVTNCSNNYGPYQHPEKLIPLTIINALRGTELPVYGNGLNVRDWLFVEDHCAGLEAALFVGTPGRTYCIGGGAEQPNIAIVHLICDTIDKAFVSNPGLAEYWPDSAPARGANSRDLIRFVTDRPGHDHRYAIDSSRIAEELGVRPAEDFASGMARTIDWYIANAAWWQKALNADFTDWMKRQYSARVQTEAGRS